MMRTLCLFALAALLAGCPVCEDYGDVIALEGGTTLRPGETTQFAWRWDGRVVAGPEACDEVWAVDLVVGGNEALGTVDACGRYTAPAALDAPRTVSLSASQYAPGTCHDCCPYAARRVRLEPR